MKQGSSNDGQRAADGAAALGWGASPVPHLVVDGDVIVDANAAAHQFLDAERLAERSLSTLLAGGDLSAPGVLRLADGRRVRVVQGPVDAGGGERVLALVDLDTPSGVLADPLAGLVGAAFLERLLYQLCDSTGATRALVGEVVDSEFAPTLLTVGHLVDGELEPDFRYALAGTPCEGLLLGQPCIHASGVCEAFPSDEALAKRGVEGYAGVPLIDAAGRVFGALVLMFPEPIGDVPFTRRLLRAYALRGSAELQRMRSERSLAESEIRYRELVEGSEDGLMVFRARSVVYANPAAARILGFDSPQALCAVDDAEELIVDADRSAVLAQFDARAASAPGESVLEIGVLHRAGHVVPVQFSASRLSWEGAPAMQVMIVDLSARKAREARVRHAEHMASLGKLTGGIAHDFNNLLAVILGNLEMIAQDGPDTIERPLRQARIAAQRGADLTERLLTFARRQALRPQRVEPAELLEETRALLAPVLGEDIELVIELLCDDAIEVDPSQLQSALINLAVNARDAMVGGGRLVLRSWAVPASELALRFPETTDAIVADHVCIEVEDCGEGMPADIRSHAFEPFFTTKGTSKGTGLGLSMVHGFVKQSRGQIELDSEPDGGTRVRLFLPRASARDGDAPPLADGARGERAAGAEDRRRQTQTRARDTPVGVERRALVIEDEDSVREVAVAMLEGLGFEVSQAADGPAGRETLAREKFDFLLSDVVLPAGQRGPDIAAEALDRDPSLAVLFMSGYAESSDFQRFRLEHDFRLVRKPFRFDQLRQEIEAVLDGPGRSAR